jgi:hypothetical protein
LKDVIIQIVVAKDGGNTAVKTFYQQGGCWYSDVEVEKDDGSSMLLQTDEIGEHGSHVVYAAVVALVEAFRMLVPEHELPNIVPVETNGSGADRPLN